MQSLIQEKKEALGIHEYAFLKSTDVIFSEEVRKLCEANACGQYAKTWACPPGVGTVEACKEKCLQFENVFFFSTLHSIEDSFDFEGMADAKKKHTVLSDAIDNLFAEFFPNRLTLAGESCDKCKTCAYPEPCRFPEQLKPSIEAYGVFVFHQAKQCGMHYINGVNTVTYFSMIFF